jgi:hypothetical protein
LDKVDVLISCVTWERLEQQLSWIGCGGQASWRETLCQCAPSGRVGPAPRAVLEHQMLHCVRYLGHQWLTLEIHGAVHRVHLPYTVIEVGYCYYKVLSRKILSDGSEKTHKNTSVTERLVANQL